jgi:hypothetical protein
MVEMGSRAHRAGPSCFQEVHQWKKPMMALIVRLGSASSPDALYIYESIDAADELLNICLRLGNMGELQNLPSRYLINFVYGGVFALKAGYSGASSDKELPK